MFPAEVLVAYLAAVLIAVPSPGPDNILAVSRGLSQGRIFGGLSSVGAGLGIMVHAVAAALGLALVVQTSPLALCVVKAMGATCLLWLGYKAIAFPQPHFLRAGGTSAAGVGLRHRAVVQPAQPDAGPVLGCLHSAVHQPRGGSVPLSILALERRR